MLGLHVEELLVTSGVEHKFHLKVEDLLILFLGHVRELLVLVEEPGGSWQDLRLVDTPSITELVHDVHLTVHHVDGSLIGNVVQPDDTIGDSLGLDELDPADLGGVVAVSTAACLGVDSLDIYNSELVSWHNTTLVKVEAIVLLGLGLVHEGLVDLAALVDDSIGLVLDGSLLLLGQ